MTGTEIATRASIEEICGYRALALELFDGAIEKLGQAIAMAERAAPRAGCLDSEMMRQLTYSNDWAETRTAFADSMRKQIDKSLWLHLIETTQLAQLMDQKAKADFRSALEKEPPEATPDNVFATMTEFVKNSDDIFKRGIATCFSNLDRRFRSHNGFKIGSRVVLEYAFDQYGSMTMHKRDVLQDIERTFYVLDGKVQPKHDKGIFAHIMAAKKKVGPSFGRSAFKAEDDYFSIRAFLNGNVHLWFRRDDLVEKVNRLLAEYYGAALGAASDVAEKKHQPKTGLARNLGWFPTPPDIVDRIVSAARLKPGMTVLEPEAGEGAIARAAALAGCAVTCVEIHPDRAAKLASEPSLFPSVTQADFLELTPGGFGTFDRVLMNPPFDDGRDIDHVMHALDFLKPGGTLISVMSAGTEFREDSKATSFRDLIRRMGGAFSDLPERSFASSGTMANTIILNVSKSK